MEISADNGGRHQLNRADKDFAVPPATKPGSNRTLEEITRSAQHLTGASGAALALSDGNVISCRACSGYLAPPVGTRLNIDTGLTATCVETGEVVCCDDTETDPRVDSSRCSGIRSILVVPVFNFPNVAGVLEVLSSKPKTFTDKHVTALQLLARLVETHFNYVSRGTAPPGNSAADPAPTPNESAAAHPHTSGVSCLSCGNRNPHDSQFCNRCGVILPVASEAFEPTELSLPEGAASIDREGLKEVYKLISGAANLATWNDIYAKLLANQQTPPAQDTPRTSTKDENPRSEDVAKKLPKGEGTNEFTASPGAAIRRRLWL